jgi:tRNA nucleotidyltransferase/poly(A) polymerase
MEARTISQRSYKDAIQVITILEGEHFTSKLAGGCVRDRLLGLIPNDFDIATVATPEQTTQTLKRAGLKVIPTGLDHGTVTVVMKHSVVEVTTLRVDVATDGRHAQVEFSDSFEADAARRDFTVNAMFEDAEGNILDYFEGQKDLSNRVLRFVGDSNARIKEDFLRILRLFRFWAKLNFTPEAEALQAVDALAEGLQKVSQERKTAELWKLLGAKYVDAPLKRMIATNVMGEVLPGFILDVPSIAQQQQLLKTKDPVRPLAWLTWLLGLPHKDSVSVKAAGKLCEDLKLSNHEKDLFVGWLQLWRELDQIDTSLVNAMSWLDKLEATSSLSDLNSFSATFRGSNNTRRVETLKFIETIEIQKGFLRRARLPLNGSDVKQVLSIEAGPNVGQVVTALKNAFREQKWGTREEGKAWLIANRKSLLP